MTVADNGEKMVYDNIILEIKNSVAVITFNRPKVLNALSANLMNEFSNAIGSISEDNDIHVLLLTGTGEKSFVAGADISEMVSISATQAKSFSERGNSILNKLQAMPKPVIAAVNGFALGGGTEIALACDFIYASETAQFGLPEINLGIIPGYGGTQRLARLIGKNKAKEMIFTGKFINAAEAEKMGIVNRVLSQELLMNEVMKTAKTIASKGRVAVKAAKQAINEGLNVDLLSGTCIETGLFALTKASPDAREGMEAFLDKRKPVFKSSLAD
ncbi:MAG: enoyl-CoA hydratase-related protein [Desulfobacterium sp.]